MEYKLIDGKIQNFNSFESEKEKPSSYSIYHKKYYEKNKDKINEAKRKKKEWERKQEEIQKQNYEKKIENQNKLKVIENENKN
jgi:hypothetical protein